MAITLEQRIDVQRIGPAKWRLVGLLGRTVFFYAEAGSEQPAFTASNEFAAGDVGSWRAIGNQRFLVVGHGGKAITEPKPDGKPGEIQVKFDGISLAL